MTFRFQGWIMDARIFEPIHHEVQEHRLPTIEQIKDNPSKYQYENKKEVSLYRLLLFPADPSYYQQISSEIEVSHQGWGYSKWNESGIEPELGPPSLSRVFADDLLVFQTTRKPLLDREFSEFKTDEQLTGKYCQVVGRLQQLDLGDCMMSFHILEPAVHSSELQDPIDDFDEDDF